MHFIFFDAFLFFFDASAQSILVIHIIHIVLYTCPTLASYHIAVSVFVVGQSKDVDVQHGAIDLLVMRIRMISTKMMLKTYRHLCKI